MPGSHRKSVAGPLLLVVATLLGLGLAELAARILRGDEPSPTAIQRFAESERGKFTRYDAELGWIGRPDVQDDFEWIDARHEVVQNRYGFRGTAWPRERSKARRVVVLGDSFTWGFGVGEEALFTRLLEDTADGGLEIVNLGVSGFGNDQELLLWQREGRHWAPDEVLVMVTLNSDYWDNADDLRYGYDKPLFRLDTAGRLRLTNVPVPSRGSEWSEPSVDVEGGTGSVTRWLLRSSALAGLVLQAASQSETLREWLETRGLVLSRRGGYDGEHPLYQLEPGAEDEHRWTLMFAILEQLAADVTRSGAGLRIVLIPSVVQVYPELWQRFLAQLSPLEASTLERRAPSQRFERWARRTGIPTTDLLPALEAAAESDPYLFFPQNRHWTPAGHRLVAAVLGDALKR